MHPEGPAYRLVRPDGTVADRPPSPMELPPLPERWVAALTGGVVMGDVPHASYDATQVDGWVSQHGGGMPCALMQRCLDDYPPGRSTVPGAGTRPLAALPTGSSPWLGRGPPRHDCPLERVEQAFTASIDGDRSRQADPHEWPRMVNGAVQRAAGGHQYSGTGRPRAGVSRPTPPRPAYEAA